MSDIEPLPPELVEEIRKKYPLTESEKAGFQVKDENKRETEVYIYSIPGITERLRPITEIEANELDIDLIKKKLFEFSEAYNLELETVGQSEETLTAQLVSVSLLPIVQKGWKDIQTDKEINLHKIVFTRKGERGGLRLEHAPVADFLKKKFNTISFNNCIFVYDQGTGTYRENAGDLQELITRIIDITQVKCSITKETRDILFYVLNSNRFQTYPFNQEKRLIPVKNGVVKIDFETGLISLHKDSPEWKFLFKFPVTYDPLADWRPFHESVISRYLEEPQIEEEEEGGEKVEADIVLYQIPAQALLQIMGDKPYKKSYILQGEANGGKTTYLEWLFRLFGQDNVSHASLHQIGNDRFVGGILEGKTLNAYDDLSDLPLQDVGTFKTLTGGFNHQIERKQKQAYEGRIFAVHVFTCNQAPDIPEKVKYDTAFWTRWEYLHFGNIFEVDPLFVKEYFTEENLSGSLNKVLNTMIEIYKSGLLVDSSASDVKTSWELSSDIFAKFTKEHMVDSLGPHTFPKEILHEKFKGYCQDTGVNERKIPFSLKSFSTLVFKNGFKEAQVSKKRVYSAFKTFKSESAYRITESDKERGSNSEIGSFS